MKIRHMFPCIALVLLVILLSSMRTQAQQKGELIIVKSADTSATLVSIVAQVAKQAVELQCNKGAVGCTVLQPGDYTLIRLPKNTGLYECSNVYVYQKSENLEPVGEILGRYCIETN